MHPAWKLVALMVLGDAVKALFAEPKPPATNFNYNYNGPESIADSQLSKEIEAEKEKEN